MPLAAVSRRHWLRLAAVAASGPGAGACARPRPAALALPTIVIAYPDLVSLRSPLTRAWDAGSNAALLQFGTEPGAPAADADMIEVPPGTMLDGQPPIRISMGREITLLPLRPYLADAAFDLTTLVPGVTAPWTDTDGDVLALPTQIAEAQFYVQHSRLKALSLQEPGAGIWTFADLRTALDHAVGADPAGTAVLVSGAWESPNFIAAVILGFGGTVRDGLGRVDLTLATGVVTEFVGFARHVRWPPASITPGTQDFVRQGFAGQAAAALFAFSQPWSFGINAATNSALRTMAPTAFPTFPARRVIPGYGGVGLAVNAGSKHPDLAARFLLWLLQPEQQQLLAAHGWAPVTVDPQTGAFWRRQMAAHPDLPRFDPDGYVDFSALGLPAGSVLLQRACVKMYQGADVATELQAVQQAITSQSGA